MPDKNLNIDKLFQQHLNGHKIPAPANAWNRLEKDLHPPAKARFIWFTRIAAASVLLLLAFGAGYFLSETNRTFDYQLAENPQVNELNTPASPGIETIKNSTTATNDALAENTTSRDIPSETQQNTNSTASQNLPTKTATAAHQNKPGVPDIISVSPSSKPGSKGTDQKIAATPVVTSSDELADNTITEVKPGNNTEAAATTNEPALAETEIIEVDEAHAENQPIPSETNENPDDHKTNSPDEVPVMSDEMLHQMLIKDHAFADDLMGLPKQKNPSNWSIGGQLSPTYSYRSVEGSSYNTPNESVDVEYFNDNEEGLLTMGGGISLSYRFTDRLSLGSGMYLSRIGLQNNEVLAYNDPDAHNMYKLATSGGTVSINPKKFEMVVVEQATSVKDSIPGAYSINGSFTQNLDYLEVPLVLNYKLLDKKFSVNLLGGLSPGILVNNRSYFEVEGQKLQTGTTENLSPMIYNSVLGIGLEYAITKKFSVNMSPAFKYSLTPVNNTNGLKYHPYSLSWFTGVSYKLY